MLILIHGDDPVAIQKNLSELKEKYAGYEIIILDGAKITITDIISASDSLSLFAAERLVIAENLLSGGISKEKEEILKHLSGRKVQMTAILAEQKEIGKLILNKYFKEAKVILCKLPSVLFRFLEAIGEKPAGSLIPMLHGLEKDRDAEFIYSMLIRQWRYLLIATDLGEKGFGGMPPWQAGKFIKQAHYFSEKKLIASYRQLLSADYRIKSGLTPYNMKQLLDIFFVSLYYKN